MQGFQRTYRCIPFLEASLQGALLRHVWQKHLVFQLLTRSDLLEDSCLSVDLVYVPCGPIVLIGGFSGYAFFFIGKVLLS